MEIKLKGVIRLTKKQVGQLYGCSDGTMPLTNGQVGFCEETGELVVCCPNCGDYTHTKITKGTK